MREPGDLDRGRVRVGGVGVGHRLDHDGMGAPDQHAAHVHADGRVADRAQSVGRGHVPPVTIRAMSKPVTQMMKLKRNTKPIT